MIVSSKKSRQKSWRTPRGAIYTVCFIGFVIPFVLALGDTILQAALCHYNQERLHYVATDVIEHFDCLSALDEGEFDRLFSALASANKMQLFSIKSKITACTDTQEETVQIKVSGRFENALGIFTWNRPFLQTYRIKASQFDTFGYLAINSYPYCEPDTNRGLSTYLPLYRPSSVSPTWHFCQDSAIGGVRKGVCATNNCDDQTPANWKQLADNLLSIY